jgi:PPP family 3-phenylpropionic acid transporter
MRLSLSGQSVPPDRKAALWRMRAVMFCQMTAMALAYAFVAVWMDERGMSETFIGVTVGLATLIICIGNQLWGVLADRTGKPEVIAGIGYVLAGAGWVWLGFASERWHFVVYAVSVGLGMSMFTTTVQALALSVLGDGAAGRGYAAWRVFGSVGWVLGSGVVPLVAANVQQIIITGGVVSALAPIALIGFKHPPIEHRHFVPLLRVLGNRALMAVVIGGFFYGVGMAAIFRFMPLYARVIGADQYTVGWLVAMNGIVALVGLPVMGLVVDRIGTRLMLVVGLAAHALRALLYSFVGVPSGLFAVQLLHLLTWAGQEIAAMVYLRQVTLPGNRATAMALYGGAMMLGAFVGGILCGRLADVAGYEAMFQVTAAISSLGVVGFLALSRRARREA